MLKPYSVIVQAQMTLMQLKIQFVIPVNLCGRGGRKEPASDALFQKEFTGGRFFVIIKTYFSIDLRSCGDKAMRFPPELCDADPFG
jgi:hypothetical protein